MKKRLQKNKKQNKAITGFVLMSLFLRLVMYVLWWVLVINTTKNLNAVLFAIAIISAIIDFYLLDTTIPFYIRGENNDKNCM